MLLGALCNVWTNIKELYKYNLIRYLDEDLDEDLARILPPRFTTDLSYMFDDTIYTTPDQQVPSMMDLPALPKGLRRLKLDL